MGVGCAGNWEKVLPVTQTQLHIIVQGPADGLWQNRPKSLGFCLLCLSSQTWNHQIIESDQDRLNIVLSLMKFGAGFFLTVGSWPPFS